MLPASVIEGTPAHNGFELHESPERSHGIEVYPRITVHPEDACLSHRGQYPKRPSEDRRQRASLRLCEREERIR